MFVRRNSDGAISGAYANKQPGIAEEELPDDDSDLLAFLNPPPPPYRISKATPWRRMTPDEASIVTGVMNETEARVQQIYQAAAYLDSSDELWPVMWQILSDAFGSDRADQLLAPET